MLCVFLFTVSTLYAFVRVISSFLVQSKCDILSSTFIAWTPASIHMLTKWFLSVSVSISLLNNEISVGLWCLCHPVWMTPYFPCVLTYFSTNRRRAVEQQQAELYWTNATLSDGASAARALCLIHDYYIYISYIIYIWHTYICPQKCSVRAQATLNCQQKSSPKFHSILEAVRRDCCVPSLFVLHV